MIAYLPYIKWALNCLEIAAAVTGLVYSKKFLPNKGPFYFAVYLCIISCLELVGKYFAFHNLQKENYFLYEWIAIPLQFVAINGIFLFYTKSKIRKIILGNILLYLLVTYGLLLLFAKDSSFKNYSYTIGVVVYILNTILYFFKAYDVDTITSYKKQFIFWIVLGSLIYYLLTYPFFAFKNTVYNLGKDLYMNLYFLNFICAYIMYILFIIAYKCSKPNT